MEERQALRARWDDWIDTIYNRKEIHRLPEFIHESLRGRSLMGGDSPDYDRNGLTEWIRQLCVAFPDLFITTLDVVIEGDRVAARYVISGTHNGDLMGLAATGEFVRFEGMTISKWMDGRVVSGRTILDLQGLVQQIELAVGS